MKDYRVPVKTQQTSSSVLRILIFYSQQCNEVQLNPTSTPEQWHLKGPHVKKHFFF